VTLIFGTASRPHWRAYEVREAPALTWMFGDQGYEKVSCVKYFSNSYFLVPKRELGL
jgi:hypothetical protein